VENVIKWEVNPEWRSISQPAAGDVVQLKFEEYLFNAKYIESIEENEIQVKIKTILYSPVYPIQSGSGDFTQLIAKKVMVKPEQIWKLFQKHRNMKFDNPTTNNTEAEVSLPIVIGEAVTAVLASINVVPSAAVSETIV
jgi:hypothetical protein